MSAPQTPERPARDGETCTCGRPAVLVYQTEKFGEVPYCGVEGGGHSAPQTPSPCPSWGDTEGALALALAVAALAKPEPEADKTEVAPLAETTPDETAWGADAHPHPLDGIQTGTSITVRLKDGRQYSGVAQYAANGHLWVHTGNEIHDVSPLDIAEITPAAVATEPPGGVRPLAADSRVVQVRALLGQSRDCEPYADDVRALAKWWARMENATAVLLDVIDEHDQTTGATT